MTATNGFTVKHEDGREYQLEGPHARAVFETELQPQGFKAYDVTTGKEISPKADKQ